MTLSDIKELISSVLERYKSYLIFVHLFGSRIDDTKRGGDIDILLISQRKVTPLKLSLRVQTRFFSKCEERIDVLIYKDTLFCREILKNAKRLDIARMWEILKEL